ncbi:MAG: Citrate synthase [Subtercola sp.]|nr:Citrate synthase [Subtercola sp.]
MIESTTQDDVTAGTAPRLTSAQVASRLNVKLETLYAYVSRGLLTGERSEVGGSTFDPLDIEAFAALRRRRAGAGDSGRGAHGRPIMVLDSELALLENDELYFRGVSAGQLARRLSFEQAVDFLWKAPASPGDRENGLLSRREVVSAARRSAKALGPSAHVVDQLSMAVTVCGSWDENRLNVHPAAVRAAGRRMIGTMVDALSDRGEPAPRSAPLAERLWPKLSSAAPTTADIRLLNSTLVLCMEHDLAISTMAARVAASARVDAYAAVAAALCSFDSTMHGAASIAAAEMIGETIRTGNAERALAAQLATSPVIPGFGHLVYRSLDPRARFLLQAMRRQTGFEPVVSAVDRLAAVVALRSPRAINLDLALGAFVVGSDLRRDAGELVFAVGRTAGWIAHIIDEYAQPALRLRPEARYTGPRPSADV